MGLDCGDFGGGVGCPSLRVGEEATRVDWGRAPGGGPNCRLEMVTVRVGGCCCCRCCRGEGTERLLWFCCAAAALVAMGRVEGGKNESKDEWMNAEKPPLKYALHAPS